MLTLDYRVACSIRGEPPTYTAAFAAKHEAHDYAAAKRRVGYKLVELWHKRKQIAAWGSETLATTN